jgi:hypothetical protein
VDSATISLNLADERVDHSLDLFSTSKHLSELGQSFKELEFLVVV